MICSQKDRVIILGGKEELEDEDCKVVEEIDFLKRNLVNLAHLKVARSNANGFMVNDSIYVFGGSQGLGLIGEKYTLSENKWREVKPKNISENAQNLLSYQNIGPASLLYE